MTDFDNTIPIVSGLCSCLRCEGRNREIYRMIGRCYNCKTAPILMLFRSGDRAMPLDCPICGVSDVHPERRATDDEIPATPRIDAEPQPTTDPTP